MAEITLREYVREIGILIENEQLEEAIAHCLHILQVHPKHLETYRQLGKAYLEANRFTDAADVFQRVLSAVPGDFVSHVGMAVIREDEGNLDAAIWHMERAYESNPANAAIHEELRRLIAQRDSVAPQKIRLTRGALAHMYARGEMYQQAIVELQTSLEEEPDRPDLQVLLAEMYWRTGQRVEAAEVCSQILEELPFCQEANRIMAAMLQTSDQAEEGTVYHRRLAALDPYAAFIESAVIDPDTVTDEAVRLMRGEWRPGEPIPSLEGRIPDWAAEIGLQVKAEHREPVESEAEKPPEPAWLEEIGISSQEADRREEMELPAGEAAGAELPAWLEEIEPLDEAETVVEQGPMPIIPPFSDAGHDEEEAEIPAWMQQAGWKESEGEAEEEPLTFSDEELAALEAGAPPEESALEEEEQLAPAEIPDWLMEIAPGETEEPEEPILQAEGDEVFAEVLGAEDEGQEEPPDWLSGIIPEAEAEAPGPLEEYSTWIEETGEEAGAEEEAPEWMRGVGQGAEEPVQAVPDWLRGLSPETNAEQAMPEPVDEAPDEAPEWLAGIAGQPAGEEPEEPVAAERPEEPIEERGDWLRGVVPEGAEAETELEAEPLFEEREPEPEADLGWLSALAPEAEPEEAAAGTYRDETESERVSERQVDWLSEIVDTTQGMAEEGAQAEAEGMAAEPAERVEEPESGLIPSWLEAEEPGESSTIVGWLGSQSLEAGEEELPEMTEEPGAHAPPFHSRDAEGSELPAWLSTQAEGAEEPEEAMREEPMAAELRRHEAQEREERLMDELEATDRAAELAREAETPDWLKEYAEEISEPSETGLGLEALEAQEEGLARAEEPAYPLEQEEAEIEAFAAAAEEAGEGPPEEAIEWLDRLRSEPGPEEELTFEEEAEEREEEFYETPDWLQEITEEPGLPLHAAEAETPSGLKDELEAIPSGLEWEESAEMEEPDWLREAGVEEEAAEKLEEAEIPDWLLEPMDEFDFEAVEEEIVEPELEEMTEEFVPEEEAAPPGPESIEPQAEEIAFAETEYPTPGRPEGEEEAMLEPGLWAPEELEPRPGVQPIPTMEVPAEAGERPAEVSEERPMPEREIRARKRFDAVDVLQSAKQALEARDFELAAGKYSELTRKKEALHTTVEDLRGTLDREPQLPRLWQVLGDAYMQMDRIAEAIEAYQKGTEVI